MHDDLFIPDAIEIPPDVAPAAPPPASYKREFLQRALQNLTARRVEALRIYDPLPAAQAMHKDRTLIRIVRGSNRAGKTQASAIEIARIVTRRDPYRKMMPPETGILYAVGYDERHIANVMWPMLSKPGQFRVVRDLETRQWRTYRWWTDSARYLESRPVPSFIPERLIRWEDIVWNKKRAGIPKVVPLHTDWEIHFFTSKAKPPKGTKIHMAWFDEEVENEDWYPEISARLSDNSGLFLWSATPQAGNPQLYDLSVEAEEQADLEHPRVREHLMLLSDNLYLTPEAKAALSASLSDEEQRVRIHGQHAISTLRIFPEFNISLHGIQSNVVTDEWAVYLSIDPGRQVCAVLFIAVPPPEHELHGHVVVFDELYLRNCDAKKFAASMAEKLQGRMPVLMLIDPNEAVKHETGSGKTVEDQYRTALAGQKIQSLLGGPGFAYGYDQVKGGLEAVRQTMEMDRAGMSHWLFCINKLPNFLKEIKHYRFRKKDNVVTDEVHKKNDHLMDCWRYLAAYRNLRWYRPKPTSRESGAYAAYKSKMKRKKELQRERGNAGVWLGPGSMS